MIVCKFEEDAREVRRTSELNRTDPAPHYHLVHLYDRLGKPAETAAGRDLDTMPSATVGRKSGIK